MNGGEQNSCSHDQRYITIVCSFMCDSVHLDPKWVLHIWQPDQTGLVLCHADFRDVLASATIEVGEKRGTRRIVSEVCSDDEELSAKH